MNLELFIQQLSGELNCEESLLTPDTKLTDVPGWSSLLLLSILLMIEEEYDIKLLPQDIQNNTIYDIYSLITQ